MLKYLKTIKATLFEIVFEAKDISERRSKKVKLTDKNGKSESVSKN